MIDADSSSVRSDNSNLLVLRERTGRKMEQASTNIHNTQVGTQGGTCLNAHIKYVGFYPTYKLHLVKKKKRFYSFSLDISQ